jgi:hypothetical protein
MMDRSCSALIIHGHADRKYIFSQTDQPHTANFRVPNICFFPPPCHREIERHTPMATAAQLSANRENAQYSTGPRTAEGRTRSSQNALRFGLFSAKNCVQPHETEEYKALATALWNDIRPQSTLQELFATELIRATWRLRRCAEVEASLAEQTTGDPMLDQELLRTQTAVDRARSQSHGIIRRSLAEIRRLQAEPPASPAPEAPAKRTEPGPRPATCSEPESPAYPHNRTAGAQASGHQIGRNMLCPCHSGQKYKRCCGRNAPAILHQAA